MKEFNLSLFELLQEIYKKKPLFIATNFIVIISSIIYTKNFYKEVYETEINVAFNTSKQYKENSFLTLNIDNIKILKSLGVNKKTQLKEIIGRDNLRPFVFLEDGSLISQNRKNLSSNFIKKVKNKNNFELWNKTQSSSSFRFNHFFKSSKKITHNIYKNHIKFTVLSKDQNYIKEFYDYLQFTINNLHEDNINKINLIISKVENKIDNIKVVRSINLIEFKNEIRKISELYVFKDFLHESNYSVHTPKKPKRTNLNPIYLNLLSVIIWSFLFMFFLLFHKYHLFHKKQLNEN